MKRFINISLVLTLIFLLCGCSGAKAKNEGYSLYRSSPVGVEIEYPSFWEVTDDKTKRIVAFASPNEGFADTFRDNVTIMSVEIGLEDLAFDDYVIEYIKKLPETISKYNKLSEEEITVGDCRAYQIAYEGNTNEGELRICHMFIQSGKYVYIYTFMAEPQSYDYFGSNSQVMLSTFKPLRK